MKLQGKGVSKGVALGRLYYVGRAAEQVEKCFIEDINKEINRFENARLIAADQLSEMVISTAAKLGKKNSLLFEIHKMMLEDLDYHDAVITRIKNEKVCAEYAVNETAKEFSSDFAEMDDEYMNARAADILDVSNRVVMILSGKTPEQNTFNEPVILASRDFAPSETAQLSRETTMALITSGGSANSHTAIFARTMGITAVVGLGDQLDAGCDGKLCAVDGDTGLVVIEPDDACIAEIMRKKQQQEEHRKSLESYRGKPAETKSGKSIKLFANIGNVKDAILALDNDAEGIGLFRSEFLYLESLDYPDEGTQFSAYKEVAQAMQGKQVIIRTMDIGADKQASYFKLPAEENPALGLRALRICLKRPEIFKTQLRAIYRASAYGRLAIMLPMVASLWEIQRAKEIAAEVQNELDSQRIAYDKHLPVGIMVETPAAAIISDILAKEVDFFSIGTNDLTQYTLAVDRQNQELEDYCDTHHESVMRLIKLTVDNAHAAGIWCGICGELGADTGLTARFIKMGVDELSVTPPAILPLKKHICEM